MSSSVSDKLLITFLISPTAGVLNSFLNFPVDLPLSDTVMIAVISIENLLIHLAMMKDLFLHQILQLSFSF